MATPLSARKTDTAYFWFFFMFMVSMIFVDLIPIWPSSIVPKVLKDNHTWYLVTFNDQLMIKLEPWFACFVVLEAFYQLPMTIWFLFALPKNNPKIPVRMLIYATTSFITTATSCFAIYKEPDMTEQQKYILLGFYGPFAGVFVYMMMDMSCRIQSKMMPATTNKKRV